MPAISGTTAIWDLSAVSPLSSKPIDIYYVLRCVSSPLPIGYLVHSDFSVSPVVGDANIANNNNERMIPLSLAATPIILRYRQADVFTPRPVFTSFNIPFI